MELPRIGCKWSMVISAIFMGASLALYQVVDTMAASVGFNAMEYWFQSLYNALLYAYTPQAFPAQFRGSACGLLSTLGRIAGILAPIATNSAYHGSDSPGVLWFAAGGAWVSAVAVGECSIRCTDGAYQSSSPKWKSCPVIASARSISSEWHGDATWHSLWHVACALP